MITATGVGVGYRVGYHSNDEYRVMITAMREYRVMITAMRG